MAIYRLFHFIILLVCHCTHLRLFIFEFKHSVSTLFDHNSSIAIIILHFVSFIIKGFWTIVFIFIVISTTFRSTCPPGFFRCLLNSGTFTEVRTTSIIESTEVACSDSVSHNRAQALSIPVLLLACSQD